MTAALTLRMWEMSISIGCIKSELEVPQHRCVQFTTKWQLAKKQKGNLFGASQVQKLPVAIIQMGALLIRAWKLD